MKYGKNCGNCTLSENQSKWIYDKMKIKARGKRGSVQSDSHNVLLGFCGEIEKG